MPRLLTAFATALAALGTAIAGPSFLAATPHWPNTRGDDLNRRVGFRISLNELPDDAILRIATSGLYRATVNGKFLGHGPARAGHGTFRVDQWPIKPAAVLLGLCFLREATERAIESDRRAGKWGWNGG